MPSRAVGEEIRWPLFVRPGFAAVAGVGRPFIYLFSTMQLTHACTTHKAGPTLTTPRNAALHDIT